MRAGLFAADVLRVPVLPALFAGGDFKHGQHLAFDQKNNYPLSNLYLNMLHNVGLMHENFATSTGTMKGITAKG